ncbi:hypothetical protein FACS1894184_03450 [Clostridia bacterium]|nr:hypothetical protein FACS1894184_03450 [Clostridia bacterium]
MIHFSVRGYAEKRLVSYRDKEGFYHHFDMPSGAALLASILHREGLVEDVNLECLCLKRHIHAEINWDEITCKEQAIIETDMGLDGNDSSFCVNANSDCVIQWGCEHIDPDALHGKRVFWICGVNTNPKFIYKKQFPSASDLQLSARCFILIDASLLRNAGSIITKQLSWERTVADLTKNLKYNPKLQHLLKSDGLLITFDEDAAVFIRSRSDENKATSIRLAILALAHGNSEGYLRSKYNRNMDYAFTLMAAATAKQFEVLLDDTEIPDIPRILRVAKHHIISGYSIKIMKEGFSLNEAYNSFEPESYFNIPIVDQLCPDNWRIIDTHIKELPILSRAIEFIRKGIGDIKSLPRFEIGEFITFDRNEIESYNNIYNIFLKYSHSIEQKPLSIAIYGTPGSGRSFGIKQIAQNVFPIDKLEIAEYNESQFSDYADIESAFQFIREIKLDDKMPIVFFNSFGSKENNWLKHFSTPMQTGEFVDKRGKHKFGKCIFVFIEDINTNTINDSVFISGLNAALNIASINPSERISKKEDELIDKDTSARKCNDRHYLLKRALVLHSFCEEDKEFFRIDDSVIWAMLRTSKYRYGVRSMRSLYEMYRIKKDALAPAILPSKTQLSLYVEDSATFVNLVERKFHFNLLIDALAQRSNDHYIEIHGGKKWDELKEGDKESNRAQVRDIPSKLEFLGCDFDYKESPNLAVGLFSDKELFSLEKAEHGRWMDWKRVNGYTYGPTKDEIHNPLMVEWGNLTDPYERKKDLDVVEYILPLLKSVGLYAYRNTDPLVNENDPKSNI